MAGIIIDNAGVGYAATDAHLASREQVLAVPTPERTRTYRPVANSLLIHRVEKELEAQGYEVKDSDYALAKNDQQTFIVWHVRWDGGEHREDVGGMIVARHSLDKSLGVLLASGLSVNICTNLLIFGDTVLTQRGRQTNQLPLDRMIRRSVRGICQSRLDGLEMMGKLQSEKLPLVDGYRAIGELAGRKLLLPRQTAVAYEDWDKPRHEEFSERNAWSLLNCCTEGLKKGRPAVRADQNAALTRGFQTMFNLN